MARIKVNGTQREVQAEPHTNLLEVLRNDLGLTGSKYGCGDSQCGACSVLIDGKSTRSCVTQLSAAIGKEIVTIEGFANGEKLHPIQQAFLDEDAMQCGFCVAGMIVSASELLAKNPNPRDDEIKRHMGENICRCCCYPAMLAAIRKSARMMRGEA